MSYVLLIPLEDKYSYKQNTKEKINLYCLLYL